jgi:hypothetical protein
LQQIYLAGKICADFPAMFFIFGSPRSGTTLLCASLELNDKIVVPPPRRRLFRKQFLVLRLSRFGVLF